MQMGHPSWTGAQKLHPFCWMAGCWLLFLPALLCNQKNLVLFQYVRLQLQVRAHQTLLQICYRTYQTDTIFSYTPPQNIRDNHINNVLRRIIFVSVNAFFDWFTVIHLTPQKPAVSAHANCKQSVDFSPSASGQRADIYTCTAISILMMCGRGFEPHIAETPLSALRAVDTISFVPCPVYSIRVYPFLHRTPLSFL